MRMQKDWGRRLQNLSYLLFLALYVFSAAAYGLTREAEIKIFIHAAAGIFLLWLVACMARRSGPNTGIIPWVAAALVLIFGWFVTGMAFIDQAVLDGRIEGWDEGFRDTLLSYCSAYDADLSLAAMLRTTALLGMMLMAIEIWRDRAWGRALLATVIFSAFSMVVFFFLQRIVGGNFLLRSEDDVTTLSFGTYRYWGNAGAYLNLFWPISAGVALFAALRQTIAWPLWIIPFAMIFAACFLNLSKAGNVLAAIGIVIFIALAAPIIAREIKRSGRRLRKSYLVGAIVPVLAVMICLPFALPWKRWDQFAKTADGQSEAGRLHAYAKFLTILPDSGWVGFGPGSFKKYYYRYVEDDPKLNRQSYWVAHQDYIQTAVEWGYIGVILWTFVLLPPGFLLLKSTRQRVPRPRSEFEGYRIGIADHVRAFFSALPNATDPCITAGATVAVLLTALHSAVDFPLQIASLQLYFLVLLALGWAARTPRNAPVGSERTAVSD